MTMKAPSHLKKRSTRSGFIVFILLAIGIGFVYLDNTWSAVEKVSFNGERAMAWVEQQCAYGYRITGSDANMKTAEMISDELDALGWNVRYQEFPYMDTTVRNVLAWRGEGKAILLGAHYDTRRTADAENSATPVMGANDGASGVAVLLELARVIEVEHIDKLVYLAFFDAEDNGRLDGWDWIVGSSYMASHWGENGEPPLQSAIIVDMIGDKDLTVYMEQNSDSDLTQQIWKTANLLGYSDKIIPHIKYAIIDDHIPFLQIGVPAIDIIDFDYPYWHTTQDTPDKVTPESLEVVGKTLETWLESQGK